MERNFKNALLHVLVHEGGWANHPMDPGGPTMKGVTLITYRRYFGENKNKADLRNISDGELETIYDSGYWSKCRCSDLPFGIDYAVFDAAVNSGPGRGAKWLQASVGAEQDGSIGPETLSHVSAHDPIEVIEAMCDNRLLFLRSLSTWADFGTGWGRRVNDVRTTATIMAGRLPSGIETATPSGDYVTVKKGSNGSWVIKLQTLLGIQADGIFGKDTDTALKAWQAEHGMEPDGIAGRNTYRAMGLIA
jgi:lysozyme family protein